MDTISVAQMRDAESWAVANGVEPLTLMENAGSGAAIDLFKTFPESRKILFVCGKGNNGGDALVMARFFALKNWKVDVCLLLGDDLSELATVNLEALPDSVNIISVREALRGRYDVVVDGVFGTGFEGELGQDVGAVFSVLNGMDAYRVALDVPSGIDCDRCTAAENSFVADVTYTFHAYKRAHAAPSLKSHMGEIKLLDIGIR